MNKKVMVAMSGAVESSVAAALIYDRGYDICGVTLKFFGDEDLGLYGNNANCFLEDVREAKNLASNMEFNHYVFNFGMSFHTEVITRFTQGYINGNTPNPCIDCKRYITFEKLFDRAMLMGFDYIATGHYARVVFDEDKNRYLLKRAKDKSKDQSYLLYFMSQKKLAKSLFPLGDLMESEVHRLAQEKYTVNTNRTDGIELCFVRGGNVSEFLENSMGMHSREGLFIDKNGKVLGTHKGIVHYTIGQRKGIGLSFATPQYVIHKDVMNNTITLGEKSDLFSQSLIADDLNFIAISELSKPMRVSAQTRFREAESPATISPIGKGRVKVTFDTPQKAVTAGQAVVFYDNDIVVGGGTIIE
ncbi:MAG: tRNA 2-thiouridine(34) synthase MnmA [Oscillospiraceae bacterium]